MTRTFQFIRKQAAVPTQEDSQGLDQFIWFPIHKFLRPNWLTCTLSSGPLVPPNKDDHILKWVLDSVLILQNALSALPVPLRQASSTPSLISYLQVFLELRDLNFPKWWSQKNIRDPLQLLISMEKKILNGEFLQSFWASWWGLPSLQATKAQQLT